MYLLNEDGLAEWWRGRDENWPFPPIILPSGGGTIPTEDEVIDDEIRRGTSVNDLTNNCLLYTSPSPRDRQKSRMPSSA